MKERQIKFSSKMMNAILEGRKTQTRRPVKPEIVSDIEYVGGSDEENEKFDFVGLMHGTWKSDDGTAWGPEWLVYCTEYPEEGVVPVGSLYGAIGDHLLATDGERTSEIEMTGFRVERLQDISEQDAIAEGISRVGSDTAWKDYLRSGIYLANPVDSFNSLWQSIYGDESWSSNPWVWVIEFKVLTTNGKIPQEAA